MSDDADNADERIEAQRAAGIEAARAAAAQIPEGYAGECDRCGIESKRLVGGYCARCRDLTNRRTRP